MLRFRDNPSSGTDKQGRDCTETCTCEQNGVVAYRVLIVEDERTVRQMLHILLEDEGFDVTAAADAEEALAAWRAGEPDLLLVDLRLPGMQGLELCRHLRQSSSVPIIIVTAQVDSHDVVAGLEAGADDYVTKPFVAKELAARIRAALRRSTSTNSVGEVFSFDDIEIRPDAGTLRRGGETVHLTKTEFRLLCEFRRVRGPAAFA